MNNIPQINNGKTPGEALNIKHAILLPSHTPYGNLLLKGTNIIRRIDRINIEIQRVFSSYVHPSKQDINNPLQDIMEHQFYEEEVIYWLKKTADEIISLAFVIEEWDRTGDWPNRITIDCIGALKSNPSDAIRKLFEPHTDDLNVLNEVANAYKHSFINTDINMMGAEQPGVIVLGLKRNKLLSEPEFYSVSFKDIVNRFSNFYETTLPVIQDWAQNKKII